MQSIGQVHPFPENAVIRFMPSNPKPPDLILGKKAWVQILLVALLLVFYIFQVYASLYADNPLVSGIGIDFRAFWSAGKIANTAGYAEVYDLERMAKVQESVVRLFNQDIAVQVVPVPNLPLFFTLFQAFALLAPLTSFTLWTSISFIGTFIYLVLLFKQLKLSNPGLLALLGLLSLPSFYNLFVGQINILLLICVGEFIRSIHKKRDLGAGLWLGGLLLKPQLLIFIGPILLLQKKWRMLGGFTLMVGLVFVISLLLGGQAGLIGFWKMIFQYSSGLPTNAPEIMLNWRMIGVQLSGFLPAGISWAVAALGMVATAVVTFLLWRKPIEPDSTRFQVAFTGTLAATLAVTWHSHLHMAMVLLPGLLVLLSKKAFPEGIFTSWLFGLPLVALFIFHPLLWTGVIQYNTFALAAPLIMFSLNLVILGWAWRSLRRDQSSSKTP